MLDKNGYMKRLLLLLLGMNVMLCRADFSDSIKYLQYENLHSEGIRQLIEQANALAPDSLERAIILIDRAIQYARERELVYDQAAALLSKAELLYQYGRSPEEKIMAIVYWQEVIPIYREISDYRKAAIAFVILGDRYRGFGKLEEAHKSYMQALGHYETLNNYEGQLRVYERLVDVLIGRGELGNARFQADQAIAQAQKHEIPPEALASIYLQLGRLFVLQKQPDAAIANLMKALAREEGGEGTISSALIFNLLGYAYEQKGDTSLANDYFLRALALAKMEGDEIQSLKAYLGRADLMISQEKYAEAEKLLFNALELAKSMQQHNMEPAVYDKFYRLYRAMGKVDEAFYYLDLREKQPKKEQKITYPSVADMELRHQLDYSQEYQSLLQKQRRQERIQYIMLAVGLLAVAGLLYYRYINKKRVNRMLEQQVAARTRQLRDANVALQHLNEELDKFAYRTTHDIRGPVARLRGLCQVGLETDPDNALTYLQMVNKEAENMDIMIHRFLDINNIKQFSFKPEQVDLRALLHSVIKEVNNMPDARSLEISLHTEEVSHINTDPRLIGIICRNIVENAVLYQKKGADEPSWLKISANKENDSLLIEFKDNGEGIAEEVAPRIFEMFYRGTARSSGLGLGLYAASLAADKMGASLSYVHHPTYTIFHLIVPISPKNS